MSDPSAFGDIDENDPRSMARWARKMGDSMGEDMGDDFNEMIDRMEAGEMPDDEGGDVGGGGTSAWAGDDLRRRSGLSADLRGSTQIQE